MSTDAGDRPCPYCGEMIKANAIKCRFCGEFLDERGGQAAVVPADTEPSAGVKMIVPVGRSGWAIASGWLAIIALIPFPLFVFILLIEQGQRNLTVQLMYLAAGVNSMFGFLAVITALGAFVSNKPGKVRAIFGAAVGLIAGIGYWGFVWYMVRTYVG